MKNKFRYISFLLLFVCVMFGFESNVKGDSCVYSYSGIDGSNYVTAEELNQFNDFISYPAYGNDLNLDIGIHRFFSLSNLELIIKNNKNYYLKGDAQYGDLHNVSTTSRITLGTGSFSSEINPDKCPTIIGLDFVTFPEWFMIFGEMGFWYDTYMHSAKAYYAEDYDNMEEMKDSIRENGKIVFVLNDLADSDSIMKCTDETQISSLKKLLDKIPNIQSFTQYIGAPQDMPNYEESISESSYFNGNCSLVTSQIKKDKEELESILSGDMVECMKREWAYDESALGIEVLKRYFIYLDGSDEGRYIADNLQTLPSIYSNLLSKENLESICEANEEKALMKDVSGIHDDERIQDLARKAKDINCEALYNAINDQLNSVQKYVKEKSNEVCQFSDKLCFISNCELIKKDLVDSAKDIASGKKQEEAEKVLSGLKTNWFEHDKVELNGKLCDTLNSDEIRPYIKGTLNVIMIAGPILTIILTILDGIKTFASMKDDEQKKFFDKLKIRLLCAALLILVPTIINFLLKFISDSFCKIV